MVVNRLKLVYLKNDKSRSQPDQIGKQNKNKEIFRDFSLIEGITWD